MFKQLSTGFFSYFKVLAFINKHRLWKAIMIPAFVGLAVFLILLVASLAFIPLVTDPLGAWLDAKLDGSWLEGLLSGFVSFLMRAITFILFLLIYKSFMLNVMSPLLNLVSDKVGSILYGEKEKTPFHFGDFMKEILLGIWDALRIFLKETFIVLAVLLLALFIPLLSPIVPFVVLLIQSYFIGISMLDISASYHNYPLSTLKERRKSFRFFALGNGIGFTLLFFIPVLGVLFAPPFGVVAACLGIKKTEGK